MEPQATNMSQLAPENKLETAPDLFVRQVEDRALPAGQVLNAQRDGLGPDVPIRVFVP